MHVLYIVKGHVTRKLGFLRLFGTSFQFLDWWYSLNVEWCFTGVIWINSFLAGWLLWLLPCKFGIRGNSFLPQACIFFLEFLTFSFFIDCFNGLLIGRCTDSCYLCFNIWISILVSHWSRHFTTQARLRWHSWHHILTDASWFIVFNNFATNSFKFLFGWLHRTIDILTLCVFYSKQLLGLLHIRCNFEVFVSTVPNHLWSVLLWVGDFNHIDHLHASRFFFYNFKSLHLDVQFLRSVA